LEAEAVLAGYFSRWVLLVVPAYLFCGCQSTKMTAKDQAQYLEQAIPTQSSPAQVIAYLDSENVAHSGYAGNSISAVVRDKSKWDIVRADYGIEFKFDEKNQLSAVVIKEHLTGP
jgi:hypothetical protein